MDVEQIGLLKVDVQGYEQSVLRGATEVLRRTRAVLLEINYIDHYENATRFDDVYQLLRDADFELAAVSEPELRRSPLCADALFVRRRSI